MIAVALENTSLQKLLEDTTKDWMKTGFIVAAEKKWGITPTEYSLLMHEQYKDK
jgi:polar amino acid transport system substrate-binding protein